MKSRLKRFASRTLPILAILVTLLVALFLTGGLQKDAEGISEYFDEVLVATIVALLILASSIIYRIVQLVRNVHQEVPGARLTARWVRNFLVLSLPPALLVFAFSAYVLTRAIDNWFDVNVEDALADSLELGQAFLDNRTLEVRNQLRDIALDVGGLPEGGELLRRELLENVRSAGPTELSVVESDGNLVATANINALTGLPQRPGDFALLQARDSFNGEYAALEPDSDGVLQISVIQRLPSRFSNSTERFLVASYPLPPALSSLTSSIEREYVRYRNVAFLRESLQQSFVLVLTLVLLLSVLLAMLAALHAARRMVAPLYRLSDATHKVADGDLGQEVAAGPDDEIGFLVSSFNDMTQALRAASQAAESSRADLQAQGELLESVLGNLSSGVLTLDESERILTANDACLDVLGLAGKGVAGIHLGDIPGLAPQLEVFVSAIRHQVARGRNDWQQEIRINTPKSPLVLLMRGTRVPLLEPQSAAQSLDAGRDVKQGQVIVFDDVTVLNQAQREAAWAEVARRLAHEVKNPLTPIRLAAERLQLKLADKLEQADGDLVRRASGTIVSQVDALRRMVDAFGDYAAEPVLSRQPILLDELVGEVVSLYQQGDTSAEFKLDLCPGPGGLTADEGRLRQMLHNLIRNASQASDKPVLITIKTRVHKDKGQPELHLNISDNGPGFPEKVLEQPFQPYVSHKQNGSGLGLAICRKIVSEHNGQLAISNPESGGAQVVITIPLDAGAEDGQNQISRPDGAITSGSEDS
ncbi:MAG TPA: ATP-binding protein [Xanthomonadales bacterium]|nr:ATP-binding protein [Xanthomonadales bacterium]